MSRCCTMVTSTRCTPPLCWCSIHRTSVCGAACGNPIERTWFCRAWRHGSLGVKPSRKQSPFYLQKVIEPTASAGMVQLILPGQWECGTRSVWSSTEEIGGWWGKTCGTWSNMFSRKLASASWSPSCFSKVLGGAGISNRMKLHT